MEYMNYFGRAAEGVEDAIYYSMSLVQRFILPLIKAAILRHPDAAATLFLLLIVYIAVVALQRALKTTMLVARAVLLGTLASLTLGILFDRVKVSSSYNSIYTLLVALFNAFQARNPDNPFNMYSN